MLTLVNLWEVKKMNNDYIKFHTLGLMAHSKEQDKKKKYELPPINTWTEEFCETLNKINYDKNIKISISSSDKLESNVDQKTQKIFEAFSHIAKVENIYVFNNLPDNINYVRFTDCVILREDNQEFATQCANSIMAGLSLLQTFNAKRDKILKEKTESLKNDKTEAEKQCNLIQKICALQAHFTADNKRSIIGSDNYIFNELLQNANDRISDGIMNISIKGNELILSYNEEGFSAKDFLAVSTSGNSGNIDDENRNNDNMNSTGHKGTGFKSVYNVFEKVVIQSGFVKCTLDDSKKINCSFEGDKIKDIVYEDWKMPDKKRYFPVPEFEFLDQYEEKTNITLTFIEGEKTSFIESNNLGSKEKFEESKVYYFLDNINEFKINEEHFDKKDYLDSNFYIKEENVEISEYDLKKNPRWKDKTIEAFKKANKSKIKILFPKENLPEETSIFCTLPVQNAILEVPFYINVPAFELEDGRNSISNNDTVENWQKIIWQKAIKGSGSSFSKIFSDFAKEHPNIAYKYFPYNCIDEWHCLKEIKFIKTITEDVNKYELMAINQWDNESDNNQQASEKKFVFLPDCMYEWFKEKKGLDGFSCDVPFVYYGHSFDYKMELLNKLNKQTDKPIEKLLNRCREFFENKFYVDKPNPIDNHQENSFLKNLLEKRAFSLQDIYRWYLGKTLCESEAHCIKTFTNTINGCNCIYKYKNNINVIFGSINDTQFEACFTNLRKGLYLHNGQIVEKDEKFLNEVLDKYRNDLSKVFDFNEELAGDHFKSEREGLFNSGKIVVKRGDKSFCLSDDVKGLFTSSFIDDARFILKEPKWAEDYVDNLDKRLTESDFYKERDRSFFEKTLEKYLKEYGEKPDVIKAIDKYIKECKTIDDKEKYLFESICKRYNGSEPLELKLDEKYLEMIDIYNKQINKYEDENKIEFNSQIIFCFEDKELSGITKYIVDKFNDRVDQKDKEKRFKFLGENESLKEILKNKVLICNDKYKNNRKYCIGTKICDKNEPQDIIIVFGEKSVGTMLRDLFNCKSYINPGTYNSMDCYLPNPLFKPNYDNWNDLNFNEISTIKYSDDKEIKHILIQRFEFKLEDKWLCFKGYGGDAFKSKRCPLCGGVMIAEASSLRIRYIQAIQGIHVPVLICSSCDEAVKYTENVYFCDEKGKAYLSDDNSKREDRLIELLKSNQNILICFDMFSNEKKIFPLDMTLLHRLICLNELKERKDSN